VQQQELHQPLCLYLSIRCSNQSTDISYLEDRVLFLATLALESYVEDTLETNAQLPAMGLTLVHQKQVLCKDLNLTEIKHIYCTSLLLEVAIRL
jgi:hypothetical protein